MYGKGDFSTPKFIYQGFLGGNSYGYPRQGTRLEPICARTCRHISAGHILSYRELDQNSDSLAAHLSTLLPDDHSPVVVIGHKEPEMLVAFLAVIKSGHPYYPHRHYTRNNALIRSSKNRRQLFA